jgi:hypothetical protein
MADETFFRRFWTLPEQRVVREHYATGGAKACRALLPHRSEFSIRQQATALGIRSAKQRPPSRPYPVDAEMDRHIVECYRNHPERGAVNRLAARLGRPAWWVKKRAVVLGVTVPLKKEPAWSPAEEELLEKNAHKSPETIRRLFVKHGYRRTSAAIVIRRKRLRLDTIDYDHYTGRQLAGEFGVDPTTVSSWIKRGWLRATRRGTARTEAQGDDHWWIKRKDVRKFVAENAAVIDLRKVDKLWFIDLLVSP